jgi:hypothetical protein
MTAQTLSPSDARPASLIRQTLWSGSMASVLSLMALMVRGRRDAGSAVAPLNAPSHWFFGQEALEADRPSWRHTATGLLVHHASAMLWGGLYDLAFCRRSQPSNVARLTAGAAAVTAVAALVDFKLVPQRLTPGFEHRLSRQSLALTYGAFALGLAISGVLLTAQRRD